MVHVTGRYSNRRVYMTAFLWTFRIVNRPKIVSGLRRVVVVESVEDLLRSSI